MVDGEGEGQAGRSRTTVTRVEFVGERMEYVIREWFGGLGP